MKFANLEQRMAQSYLDMFPKFVPDKTAEVGKAEQEKFYKLINNLYLLAKNEPLLFVTSLHDDDAFPERFMKPYGKPELILNMRKFIKEMDSLLQNMFLLGQDSNTKISKKQKSIMAKLGINDFTKLPSAWTWMSTRPDAKIEEFIYCLFDRSYSYASDIYASALGESSFRKLEQWMKKQGYRPVNSANVTASNCRLSLTYANPIWSKERPRGGFEYKIRHTGISAQYDFHVQKPFAFGLCIPNGLKTFLEAFDSMSQKNKKFVLSRTKKCDGCKYCVQTDKTGTRPMAFIQVNNEGQKYNLCPYFPGYSYSWNSIDDELADQLIEILSFMDKFAPEKK